MAHVNREITFYTNTLTYLLNNLSSSQRGYTTESVDPNNESVWETSKGILVFKDADNDLQVLATQKYYDSSSGTWIRRGNVFGDIEADNIYTEEGLQDQYLSAAIPISETGITGLDGGFTATSIVGALNELKNDLAGDDQFWEALSSDTIAPKAGDGYDWIYANSGLKDSLCLGIPLSETDNGSLDVGFTATSIIGAINELKLSTYAFKTITGITNDVVADTNEATLTLTSANNRLTIVGTTASDTITFTLDESKIDHDNLTNFSSDEHFVMTAITNVSSALSTGLLKVTTGTGALSVITDSSANWDTAYDHSQDNSQAHSDYLVNNADDSTSGALTVGSLVTGGNIGLAADTDLIQLTGANAVTVNGALTLGSDVYIPADSRYIYMGTANDARFYFDGSAIRFEPSLVGTTTDGIFFNLTRFVRAYGVDGQVLASQNVGMNSYINFTFARANGSYDTPTQVLNNQVVTVWDFQARQDTGGYGNCAQLGVLAKGDITTINWGMQLDFTTCIQNTVTKVSFIKMSPVAGSAEVVINDGSNDINFRVESDGNANMLVVDAGLDAIGIAGAATTGEALTVTGDSYFKGEVNLQTGSHIEWNGVDVISIDGTQNTLVGVGAGNIGTCGYSTYVGYHAGFKDTAALGGNIGIGAECLNANAAGTYCVAIGYQSQYNNLAGYNISIGGYSLYSVAHASAGQNIAIGYSAMYYSGNSSVGNFAMGYKAMRGVAANSPTYCIAIGYENLYSVTTASNVTSIGYHACYNLTSSAQVTAVGTEAFYTMTAGATSSVALGYRAGYYETGVCKLFIDNAARANEADGRVKALVYGVFDAATANQLLRVNGNLQLTTIKSGATQAASGAAANEVWKTASHASLPDNVLMIGV